MDRGGGELDKKTLPFIMDKKNKKTLSFIIFWKHLCHTLAAQEGSQFRERISIALRRFNFGDNPPQTRAPEMPLVSISRASLSLRWLLFFFVFAQHFTLAAFRARQLETACRCKAQMQCARKNLYWRSSPSLWATPLKALAACAFNLEGPKKLRQAKKEKVMAAVAAESI